jgi:hypothetical protein
MAPTALDAHHDCFVRFAKGRRHLMDIVAQCLGINVWHNQPARGPGKTPQDGLVCLEHAAA